MNIKVTNQINTSKVDKMLESDELWKFAATEWWRAYYDDVPHDTNMLRQKVKIRPKEIEHFSPHSRFIYFGMIMEDPQYKVGGFTNDGGVTWFSRPDVKKAVSTRPLKLKNGSRLWDEKAKQEKKDLLVVKSMQNWINKKL